MPAPAAAARKAHRPARACDELREALLARVQSATAAAWSSQDAELDAEMAALEAAGDCAVPAVAELEGLAPDPYAGPPEGVLGWLADLPGPLLAEYLAATAEPPGPEQLTAGPWAHSGRSCECNLAPLCRRHHQAKQAHGWWLDQPRPGVLTWTTPSGRRYTTLATVYPT